MKDMCNQKIGVGVAKGLTVTATIVGSALVFVPVLLPIGVGLLASSGVSGLAIFAGDEIAKHIKDYEFRSLLIKETEITRHLK